jgi:hypothetical protein
VLREQDIAPGKFYVNNGRRVAREVLRVKDQVIVFNTHHLDTGNSCGSPSECSRQDFTNWADHEASPSEIARVQ